jgi:hypothetical protein
MSVAELLLRLGCSLVAWLVLYAHCLWLAALRTTGCGGGSVPWRVLLGWTPVVLTFAWLLRVGFAVPGVGRALRLPGVLLVPLLLLAGRVVIEQLVSVNWDGRPICGSASIWTVWWAPVQLATLFIIGIAVRQAWRRGAS